VLSSSLPRSPQEAEDLPGLDLEVRRFTATLVPRSLVSSCVRLPVPWPPHRRPNSEPTPCPRITTANEAHADPAQAVGAFTVKRNLDGLAGRLLAVDQCNPTE